MNELQTQSIQLPDNIEDLSRFALIGRDKLKAVKAEIHAIEKVGLAKEVHEQKLKEAQDIADAVLDAEVKIGELTSQLNKAKENQYTKVLIDSSVERQKPKSEALNEIGISQKTAERFERLAKNPEMVQAAKDDARERGEIVTRQAVFDKITDKLRAEHDTIRKQEAQELREAKQRHEDFQEQKSEGVVSLEAVKQDKEDYKLLFEDFWNDFHKASLSVYGIVAKVERDEIRKLLLAASIDDLKELYNTFDRWMLTARQAKRIIEEIKDEKQHC